jgi:hypothetical protein
MRQLLEILMNFLQRTSVPRNYVPYDRTTAMVVTV